MGSEDLLHKRKAKKAKALQRPKTQGTQTRRYLIVCEGEKTEVQYFSDLRDDLKIPPQNVCGHHNGSAPSSVLKHAKKLYQESHKSRDAYDRVFCVFDKDAHPSFQDTVNQLTAPSLKKSFASITTVPCFEYWLLLHFDETDQPFDAAGKNSVGDQAEAALRKHLPEYEKNTAVYALVRERTDRAIKHAQGFQKKAQKAHENPSTMVHELVLALQELAQTRSD
jgi:RloB-like protein